MYVVEREVVVSQVDYPNAGVEGQDVGKFLIIVLGDVLNFLG